MITSKSPRKVLKLAYALGLEVLPTYFSRFSRHAFTKPQLFACLVLREHQRKSFRGVEALLADSPQWLADIGMAKVPDHHTLWRACNGVVGHALACARALDAAWCATPVGARPPTSAGTSSSAGATRRDTARQRREGGRSKR